jgi:peptide/nickel transport system permease protein
MAKFLAGKVGQYLLVLFLTLTLNFMLPRMMPGNPAQYILGEDAATLTPEMRATILANTGLNLPLWDQYVLYLKNLSRGNLGFSYQQSLPISDIIASRLPWTLLLTGISLLLSTAGGVVLGTWAAWRRGQKADVGVLSLLMFINSMPTFWLGMVFIIVFGMQLRLFPLFGARNPWADYQGLRAAMDVAWHLVLPCLTLTLHSLFGNFMIMRYSMVSVLGEDFILMAKAKGLRNRVVMYRHAMRNALLPMATVFMLNLGFILGGATVTETVFAFPGLGRLMYEAVLTRDYPVLQGAFLIITLSVIIGNILADLVYPLLDPRVRRAASA